MVGPGMCYSLGSAITKGWRPYILGWSDKWIEDYPQRDLITKMWAVERFLQEYSFEDSDIIYQFDSRDTITLHSPAQLNRKFQYMEKKYKSSYFWDADPLCLGWGCDYLNDAIYPKSTLFEHRKKYVNGGVWIARVGVSIDNPAGISVICAFVYLCFHGTR